jgi:Protein of unknown function DUF72
MDKLEQAGNLVNSLNVERPYSEPGLLLGTSAFTANGWPGTFYPAGMKPTDFLSYYANQFITVEIDSTYYATPSASIVTNWYERTPPDFIFAAKVPQVVTHEKVLLPCPDRHRPKPSSMKVSCLVLLLTASPKPRAVLNSNTFTPMLSKTAYPAAFWMAAWEVGSSLYKSCKASAAILRVFSLFFSLSSSPPYATAESKTTARIEAIILNFIRMLLPKNQKQPST